MRKVCAKLAPKLLIDDQKVFQDNINCIQTETELLFCLISGWRLGIFEYDPETKWQSGQ